MIKKHKTAPNLLKYTISITILLTLLTTACAKIDTVSTNLDPKNFKNYFSPITVEIVASEKEFIGQ